MVLFNDSHLIPLIEECRRYPCLWAVGTNDHKDPIKREAALLDIIKNLGIPKLTPKALLYKINNLKCTYLHEFEREQKIKIRKRKGVTFRPLHFWYRLADTIWRPNPLRPDNKYIGKGKYLTLYSDTPRAEKDKDQTSESESSEEPKTPKLSSNSITNIAKLKPVKVIKTKPVEEDEFDIFGRSVAVQLRQMPLSNALNLQAELQAMITKHRIGLVDKGISGQPSSTSDYQPAEALTSEVHLKFEPDVKFEPSEFDDDSMNS